MLSPAVTRPLPVRDLAGSLLLPLAMVPGGAWFWPAACMLAIMATVEQDHRAMLIWYGLAVGSGAEALVLAPFVLVISIQRRVPPVQLGAAAALAAGTLSGRWIAGAAVLPSFPLDTTLFNGAPNVWMLARVMPWFADVPLIGLAYTAAIGCAAAYVAWFSARPVSERALLDAALLCMLVMTNVMPGLDISTLAPVVILAVLLAIVRREAIRWRIAALVVGGVLIGCSGVPELCPSGALAMLFACFFHAQLVLKPAANDNPLMARTA